MTNDRVEVCIVRAADKADQALAITHPMDVATFFLRIRRPVKSMGTIQHTHLVSPEQPFSVRRGICSKIISTRIVIEDRKLG